MTRRLQIWLILAIAACVVAIGAIGLAQFMGQPTAAPSSTVQPTPGQQSLHDQLVRAGYHLDRQRQYHGGNAARTVTDEFWTRDTEPKSIVLSDDTSPKAGDLRINTIEYDGTDGTGHTSCSPKDPGFTGLSALLTDAATVQANLNGGSKPGSYSTKTVVCVR